MRLKLIDDAVHRISRPEFLFQTGAIKTSRRQTQTLSEVNWFLFQTGAIKTEPYKDSKGILHMFLFQTGAIKT